MADSQPIFSLENLRRFYDAGSTRSYSFRKEQLKKLKTAILQNQQALHDALYTDLKKSAEESWVTETGFLVSEINAALKNLRQWMHPERVGTTLVNFPSSSRIIAEPMGVVLIIGPWNYPLQLLLAPLVGAIAAGNCAVLKSSEFAPATTSVIKQLILENFPPEYILFTEGEGAQIVPGMMSSFRFDHIFFTGGVVVGKLIYKMAAEELTPVTLELGGKSPCVVESDASIRIAARRIVMTKFSNAGQMCVAPDYVLVHESIKDAFVAELKKTVPLFFSADPSTNYSYCKIINERQFNRLINYLKDGSVRYGGHYDKSKLYIEPTIMDEVSLESPIMNEEIFGPILPIIPFKNFDEARQIIGRHPNPLALYVYTANRKKQHDWVSTIPSGGVCINNSSWHFTNHHLPVGGRGSSGFGRYHGKFSFDTFSHRKAVMKTPTWFDPSIKYPPFKGKLWLFKKLIR